MAVREIEVHPYYHLNPLHTCPGSTQVTCGAPLNLGTGLCATHQAWLVTLNKWPENVPQSDSSLERALECANADGDGELCLRLRPFDRMTTDPHVAADPLTGICWNSELNFIRSGKCLDCRGDDASIKTHYRCRTCFANSEAAWFPLNN